MEFGVTPFQQRCILPVNGTHLTGIAAQRLGQKCAKEFGVTLDFFAEAGVEHLDHIHHARGLIMQIFHRKGFELLAGFLTQEKGE